MERIAYQIIFVFITLMSYGQTQETFTLEYNELSFIDRVIPEEAYQSGYRSHMDVLGVYNGIVTIKEEVRVDRTTHFYTTALRIHYFDVELNQFVKTLELYSYSDPGGAKFGGNLTSNQQVNDILYFHGTVYSMSPLSREKSEIKKSLATEITAYTFDDNIISTKKILLHTGKYPYSPSFRLSSDSSYLYANAESILNKATGKNYKAGIVLLNEDLEVSQYIKTNLEFRKINFSSKNHIVWVLQTDDNFKKYPEILVYRLNLKDGSVLEESTYNVSDSYGADEADFLPVSQSKFSGVTSFDDEVVIFIVAESCKTCVNKARFFKVDVSLVDDKNILDYSKMPFTRVSESSTGNQNEFQIKYLASFESQDYSSNKIFPEMQGLTKGSKSAWLGDLTYKREYNDSYTELYSKHVLLFDSANGYMLTNILNFNPRVAGDYFRHTPCIISQDGDYINLLSNFSVPKIKDEELQMREYFPQVLQLIKVGKESNDIERYNVQGSFQEAEKNWTFYTGETFHYEGKLFMLLNTPSQLGVTSISW
jgi:hypothetical protein